LKTLILKFTGQKCYFNPSVFIELNQTNLPTEEFAFSNKGVYWLTQMTAFNKENKALSLSVINYNLKINSEWKNQNPKSSIDHLFFVHIDWELFKNNIAYYTASCKKLIPTQDDYKKQIPASLATIEHTVSLSQATIEAGFISYYKKVKWAEEKIQFKVPHPLMIPEFNLIKPYFEKILKKKTFKVLVNLHSRNKEVSIDSARSHDLSQINEDSLHIIKQFQIKDWKKKLDQKPQSKPIIPLEESEFDSTFGNIDEFEKALLFHFFEDENIRNKKQLQYLSSIMHAHQKLLITVQPQFGFIFTVIGEQMTHCIWELINSHASYVWSFESKGLSKKHIRSLEEEFSIINSQGRAYYKLNNNSQKQKFYFNTLQHKNLNNPLIDHFAKWRLQLDQMMV